ncbi:ankyrin repeat-containing domain protein [Phyllosticta capitalensis]|uniref:ankyrin repeat-containing domain protein n=1 Tax=Phyllosticta capitalensis TaxID=121624 RepID=UPI00313145F8
MNTTDSFKELHEIQSDIQRMLAENDVDKRIAWLSAPNPGENHEFASHKRHSGTGQWLLQRSEYLKWKSCRDSNSFLWLRGKLGSGKTILSSMIVEDLKMENIQRMENIPGKPLYFYFDFANTRKQSLKDALRSLINQLCNIGIDPRKYILQSDLHTKEPTIQSLLRIFHAMVEKIGEVWIVLDALDECATRHDYSSGELLPWVEQLMGSQKACNIHLLVTSRPEYDILDAFEGWVPSDSIVPIQSDTVADDIAAYIHKRVAELKILKSKPKLRLDLQPKIEDALLQKADGVFRWVACQLDDLNRCIIPSDIEKTLQTLPDTLDETYARILRGSPGKPNQTMIRILQFLIYSADGSLSIKEAVDAIAVELTGEHHFDPNNRPELPEEHIAAYCSSLVEIFDPEQLARQPEYVAKQGFIYVAKPGLRMRLAHFSVKEYLTSTRLELHVRQDFEESVARASVAKVCLAYWLGATEILSSEGINPFDCDTTKWFPLAKTATSSFAKNAEKAGYSDKMLCSLMERFFTTKNCHLYACQIFKPRNSTLTPLSSAARLGSVYGVRFLLRNGANVNSPSGQHDMTGLEAAFAALEAGNFNAIQLLTKNHADPNIRGIEDCSPLVSAVESGSPEIMQLLFNNGYRFKIGEFTQCLGVQACFDPSVLQTLIRNFPKSNYRNSATFALLTIAAYLGERETFCTLISEGADANGQGGKWGSALNAAASAHESDCSIIMTIELLVELGADINAVHPTKGGPLHRAAAGRSRTGTVSFLLDKGVNFNECGEAYGTPLQEALWGSEYIFFNRGADVNLCGGTRDDTPLQEALWKGGHDTAYVLINRGADVNLCGGTRGTALLAAATKGYLDLVKALLRAGADPNISSGPKGLTALQAATEREHWEVARLLLENGANEHKG